MTKFIGRKHELQILTEICNKKTASFVVINGRRRIGKSKLIEKFGENFDNFYSFIGLPPDEKTTAKHQLDEFSRQISREFNTANAIYADWSDAFWAIGEKVKSGKTLLVFDEISWMGSQDPTFLGKIKNFWDSHLKNNNNLVFIVCGSASSWIEKNILSSTGFVGRISLTLTVEQLKLSDCNKFWSDENISAYEKFKILAITGGVPKYLEEILPNKSAEYNINRLCFTKGGFLVEEFEQIFSDIFLRKTNYYKKIVTSIANGAKDQSEICAALKLNRQGRLSEYLHELELAGFVTKDHSWNLTTGQERSTRKYRLSDNYLRFYIKYIEKNKSKINRNAFALKSINILPNWYSTMGFQFENLVLSNRNNLHQALAITPEAIICDNPYFQNKTTRTPGCQIDYMIQTKFDTLYICEIKFSKHKIGLSVIKEVQQKITRLKKPKSISCRPVIIHVNGVTDELIDSGYFANIIDFSQLLKAN